MSSFPWTLRKRTLLFSLVKTTSVFQNELVISDKIVEPLSLVNTAIADFVSTYASAEMIAGFDSDANQFSESLLKAVNRE